MKTLDLFPQLKSLYTLEEWQQQRIGHHTALFITPNGNIFNLRAKGNLSHIEFARKFYENYPHIKKILSPKEQFLSPIEDLIEQGLKIEEAREYYLDCFKNVAYNDYEAFHQLRLNWLSSENLLVNDFGFVLISQDIGLSPQVVVPLNALGHRITPAQKEIAIQIVERLKYQTSTDYNSELLIALARRKSNDFSNLLNEMNTSYNL